MPKHLRGFVVLLVLGCLLAAGVRLSAAAQPALGWGYTRGPYLQISTENYDKFTPAVAYDSIHNEYLVVWEAGGAKHKIAGRRIASDGTLLPEFLISDAVYADGTYNRQSPSVVYDSIADRYLVVWGYDSAGDTSDWDIYGRYLAWNGPVASYPEFAFVTERESQFFPKLAFNSANGDVLLVWLTNAVAGHSIEATLIHGNGSYTNLVDPSSGGSVTRRYIDVAFNSGLNQYLIVWDLFTATNDLDVHGVRLDSLGGVVATGDIAFANSAEKEQHPAVAGCASVNQFLVVFQRSSAGTADNDIWGTFLAGNGALTAPFYVEGTTGQQGPPDVSCNYGGGEYFVAWQNEYTNPLNRFGIWGKWMKPDGTSKGAFEIVAPSTLRDRQNPAVASGRSTALVTWEHFREPDPAYRDIWGSILTNNAVYLPILKK